MLKLLKIICVVLLMSLTMSTMSRKHLLKSHNSIDKQCKKIKTLDCKMFNECKTILHDIFEDPDPRLHQTLFSDFPITEQDSEASSKAYINQIRNDGERFEWFLKSNLLHIAKNITNKEGKKLYNYFKIIVSKMIQEGTEKTKNALYRGVNIKKNIVKGNYLLTGMPAFSKNKNSALVNSYSEKYEVDENSVIFIKELGIEITGKYMKNISINSLDEFLLAKDTYIQVTEIKEVAVNEFYHIHRDIEDKKLKLVYFKPLLEPPSDIVGCI